VSDWLMDRFVKSIERSSVIKEFIKSENEHDASGT